MGAVNDPWAARTTPAGAPYGTLHASECKQQFSLAAAHAIATAARCTMENIKVDVERVDFTVRQATTHLKYTSSVVDVQMKCTEQDLLRDDGMHWSLSRDHYDRLRDPDTYHRKILVVMQVPRDPGDWLVSDDKGMLLRTAGYWACVEGAGPIDTGSTTVVLPTTQPFDVDQLLGILQRVGNGGAP